MPLFRVSLNMPFVRDLFYGLRLFRRNPAFYLLGVLIISLGISAIFRRAIPWGRTFD